MNRRTKLSLIAGISFSSVLILQSFTFKDAKTFFDGVRRAPRQVGALFECSSYVGHELTKYLEVYMKTNPDKPLKILEVGAGTGSVTDIIVQKLRSINRGDNVEDEFDAVEIDSGFCSILQKKFGKNPQVAIHCTPIENWHPMYEYDFIICTLPFNSLEKAVMHTIVDHLQKLIKHNGIFSYVAYVGTTHLKISFLRGQSRIDHLEKVNKLDALRNQYQIDSAVVMKNIPPIHIYHLRLP